MSSGTRFLKSVSRNWWVLYWIVAIMLYLIGWQWFLLAAVIYVGIVLFIALLKRRSKASISRNLLGIEKIGERDLARLSGVYIEEAHSFLHDVSRNPDATGIPILVKGEYIYFSNDVIKKFKQLYKAGKNTKELLEEMPQFETREEVKKMLEKLKEFDELPSRKKEGEADSGAAQDVDGAGAEKKPGMQKLSWKGIHPAIGVLAAIVGVLLLVWAAFSLYNGQVSTVIFPEPYHVWLEEISNATGYGMVILGVGIVFSFAARRRSMIVALCTSVGFALATVIYINNFRPYAHVIPYDSATETVLQSFKLLVGSLEALAIVPAVMGILAEINYLRKPKR